MREKIVETMMSNRPADIASGRICVSVAGRTVAEALAAAGEAAESADVVEIRLDALQDPEITPFVSAIDKPLLFTNRPVWEGGGFDGPEEERVLFLLQAVKGEAAYVDLEMKAPRAQRDRMLEAIHQNKSTHLIISWHDFNSTPEVGELRRIFEEQAESGATIGKMVTMARNFKDVLRVLALQELAAERNFPLIAFCMGRAGAISRFATLELGGYMTYAAPDSGTGTAPGQLTVSTLHAMQAGLDDAVNI